MQRRSSGESVQRPAILVAAGLIAVVVALAAVQGSPAYFLQLGDESRNLHLARDVFGADVPTPVADGHDGENFWVLARDPLLRDDDAARRFDRPLYRAQRIGYPLLAAPWRLFGEQALAWGLVVTNVLAIALGTLATSRLAIRYGLRPELGYAFALNPMVVLALLFDFSDAVALAGVVGAIAAVSAGRNGAAASAAVVGGLAKESSLVPLMAAALLGRGLSLRARMMLVVPAGVSVGVWRAYVVSRAQFGNNPEVQEFETVPFSGFVDAWRRAWSPLGSWTDAAIAVIVVIVAAVVVVMWLQGERPALVAAGVGVAAMIPFLSAQVVALSTNSLRAGGALVTVAAFGVALRRANPTATTASSVSPRGVGDQPSRRT